MCAAESRATEKVIADNRKARHNYTLFDTVEAGIVLLGTEVKAIREGRVNLRDSYGRVEQGEIFLYNVMRQLKWAYEISQSFIANLLACP